jgi:hypothetical protein
MSNWERRPLSAAQLQYAALDASCAHPLLSALAALVPDWRADAVTLGTLPPPPPPPSAARSTPAKPEAAKTRALGPEDVTAALAELLRADGPAGGEAQAQASVLELRAQGHTSAEAAAALGVSADRIVKSIGVICGGGSGSAVSE